MAGERSPSDQPNASAGAADLFDQLLVPRPIEDDDDQIADGPVQPARDRLQILGDARVEVDETFGGRADDQLLHVAIRCIEEAAFVRSCQHCDRPG